MHANFQFFMVRRSIPYSRLLRHNKNGIVNEPSQNSLLFFAYCYASFFSADMSFDHNSNGIRQFLCDCLPHTLTKRKAKVDIFHHKIAHNKKVPLKHLFCIDKFSWLFIFTFVQLNLIEIFSPLLLNETIEKLKVYIKQNVNVYDNWYRFFPSHFWYSGSKQVKYSKYFENERKEKSTWYDRYIHTALLVKTSEKLLICPQFLTYRAWFFVQFDRRTGI